MSNAYPEKPIVPYQRTTITMDIATAYLRGTAMPVEVKRAAYIMLRIESANGQSGINNNYAGVQADSGRWPAKWDEHIVGVVQLAENGTGRERLFVAFDRWQTSMDFLLDRVRDRGLYVGGKTHLIVQMPVTNVDDLCTAYTREWATGIATAKPSSQAIMNWRSMYAQATDRFPSTDAPVASPASPPVSREDRLADAIKRITQIAQEALST